MHKISKIAPLYVFSAAGETISAALADRAGGQLRPAAEDHQRVCRFKQAKIKENQNNTPSSFMDRMSCMRCEGTPTGT